MQTTEKPKVKLIGQNGNVFNLIGICSRALRDTGQSEKIKEMTTKITETAKSYEEALSIMMDYCDIG